MISAHPASWSTRQWLALVAVLLAVIVVLVMLWPRPPDRVIVRIVDGPTPVSTVVVSLR